MRVAIVIYEGFTSLDATGPFEVLCRLPEAEVAFVSPDGGVVTADQSAFSLPSVRLDEFEDPDIVVVAGGSTTQSFLDHEELLDWLRRAHARARWTTSVCTGSLLLGAAGLLNGAPATSHWYELESLAVFGAIPTAERVIVHGRVITCAGVSAGIDMALSLAAEVEGDTYAQAIQLAIEYDPRPPHNSGSLAVASAEVTDMVRRVFQEHYGPSWHERANEATSTSSRPQGSPSS